MADGNITPFPRSTREPPKLASIRPASVVDHPMCAAFGFPPVEPVDEPDRYVLHATVDGYVIRDRGEVICRFHGPHFDLASKTLRHLIEGEPTPPFQPAA